MKGLNVILIQVKYKSIELTKKGHLTIFDSGITYVYSQMNFLKKINLKYPQIFEYYFSFFLKKQIKYDFIPNGYTFFETPNTIGEWGEEHSQYFKLKEMEYHNSFYTDRTYFPLQVFKFYAGYFSIPINSFLRDKTTEWIDTEQISKRIEIIKKEMNTMQLREDIVVIRRVSNKCLPEYKTLKIGSVIRDKAFLSTSIDLSYRKNHESIETPMNDETLILIKVKRGTNAAYLESISNREEYELLLTNDLDIVIEKKTKILNNRIILAKTR